MCADGDAAEYARLNMSYKSQLHDFFRRYTTKWIIKKKCRILLAVIIDLYFKMVGKKNNYNNILCFYGNYPAILSQKK